MSTQVIVGAKRRRSPSVSLAKKTRKTGQKKLGYPRNWLAKVGRAFPEKIRTTLRYSDITASYGAAAGAMVATAIYCCNGLYDPYFPIGGHQPYGFDQYMAVYNHYSVIKSNIKVTFQMQNADAANNFPGVVGINFDDDGTDASTATTRIEKTGRKNYGVIGEDHSQVVLRDSWSCKQKFGAQSNDLDKNIGSITSNPSETSTWFIWYLNNGGTTGYVQLVVDIEYDVEFTELKDFGPS